MAAPGLPVAPWPDSSRPPKDSDGAEEQKRHYSEHHQMPRLKQIKQSTHPGTPATPLSHETTHMELLHLRLARMSNSPPSSSRFCEECARFCMFFPPVLPQ